MAVSKRASRKTNPYTSGTGADPSATGVSLPQGIALVAVLLLFLGATFVAFTQSPRINLLATPTLGERLFYPLESNAIKRLPIIAGNLNDVFVLPGSQLAWIVGDGGMILHSKDGGITWVQQAYPVDGQPDKAEAIPLSLGDRFSLFPLAVAAIEKDPKARYQKGDDTKPSATQQIPTQQSPVQQAPVQQSPTQQSPIQQNAESVAPVEEKNTQESNATEPSTQPSPTEGELVVPDKLLPDLFTVFFEDAKHGAVLSRGEIIRLGTSDGGATWKENSASEQLLAKAQEREGRREQLFADYTEGRERRYRYSDANAREQFDDKRWLQVGDGGLIARTDDAGEIWYPLSRGKFSKVDGSLSDEDGLFLSAAQLSDEELATEIKNIDDDSYQRFPAPWYWLVCCLVIFYGVYFFTRKADSLPPEESIADLLASDRPLRPGDPDPLGYNSIACGLSRFMRNPSTEPPLTLAITGAWGSGKSSLMNLLYYDLKKFGFTPVWFNAWHHQKGEQLLASLYANIRNQAVPGLFSFSQMIPVGLMFRINLLFRRGVKHWFVTVVLIGVFAASATYLCTHTSSSSMSLNKVTEALVTPGFSWETLLVALFGNVAPLMALLQALRAFGLNPLSLMTAQGDRQTQRQVDPSARQQFAREFNEVAKSLSLGRMVIFIDDLDRCSKENVVDILEAINFLSVSGDCYIVLGMDETWVKICIDEHFKEMSKDKPDFSEQYLEKMINIKVPVPQLSDADSSKLLAWDLPDANSDDASTAVQFWNGVKGALHPYRYFLLMVCVVVLGICFGFFIDSLFKAETKTPSPSQTIATWNNIEIDELSMVGGNPNFTLSVYENTAPTASDNATSASSAASRWELSLTATEDDLKKGIVIGKLGDAKASAALVLKGKLAAKEISSGSGEGDSEISRSSETKFLSGQHDNYWGDFWLPLLVAVLLGAGVAAYSMRMPVRRPKDSVEFKQALNIWKPWILLNRQTPRAIKRYLNRVRYMAMRYRTEPEAQTRGLGAGFLRLFRKDNPVEKPVHSTDAQLEAKLVALSAIQAVNTPWAVNVFDIDDIKHEDLHALVKEKFGEQAGSSDKAIRLVEQLWESIGLHREEFGDTIGVDEEKQKDFEKMLANMQVG